MNIIISDKAITWYKEELNLKSGDNVRFFARYGGHSPIQSGFSLGVNNDQPIDIGASVHKNDLTFFVEESDIWYFDGHDLKIDYNEKYNEPEFHYEK